MSTTTTRHAYRRTGTRWQGEPIAVESRCSCGQTFADLGALMGHECPDDFRANGTNRPAGIPTGRSDSLDTPEWRGGAAGHAAPAPKASEAQVRFLVSLGMSAEQASRLSKRDASKAIDRLKAEAPKPEPQAERTEGCRPNRFAGPCRFCGANVEAGQGLLCRIEGAWAVEHAAGACQPSTGHTAASPATPAATVAAGHYAIPSSGVNDLAFYRVDHGEGRWTGRTFVKMIVGGHPERNVPRAAVAGILERIAADPDAGPRYGREIGRCCVCNRELTDDESRAAGIGPKCAAGGRD